MWIRFLDEFNGKSFFLDDAWETSHTLELYTDAAGLIGFGAVFGKHWFGGEWPLSCKSYNIAVPKSIASGRDPFNQNFRKFRSRTEWIGTVEPEKFRKNRSTFRGGSLFSVGPIRSKWTVPFHHSDPFSIPVPRCSVFFLYIMEENTYYAAFMDC